MRCLEMRYLDAVCFNTEIGDGMDVRSFPLILYMQIIIYAKIIYTNYLYNQYIIGKIH